MPRDPSASFPPCQWAIGAGNRRPGPTFCHGFDLCPSQRMQQPGAEGRQQADLADPGLRAGTEGWGAGRGFTRCPAAAKRLLPAEEPLNSGGLPPSETLVIWRLLLLPSHPGGLGLGAGSGWRGQTDAGEAAAAAGAVGSARTSVPPGRRKGNTKTDVKLYHWAEIWLSFPARDAAFPLLPAPGVQPG